MLLVYAVICAWIILVFMLARCYIKENYLLGKDSRSFILISP